MKLDLRGLNSLRLSKIPSKGFLEKDNVFF